MTSTNTALSVAGYTKGPSRSYGCREIFKDGVSVGHFDCQTAWGLPGMHEADDDLVEVQFSSGRPAETVPCSAILGVQHDAHCDAWMDALDLIAPSGYRAA